MSIPKTGQSVQHRPYFEIAQADDGWRWCLWSGNGRQMAVSPVAYKRRNDVTAAIRTMVAAVPHANHIAICSE